MSHKHKHTCTVCQAEYDEDEGGVEGEFGILPVCFCPFCYASCVDMVMQLEDMRDLRVLEESEEEGGSLGNEWVN